MSAQILREAAALMRSRAEACTEAAHRTIRHISTHEVAEHIASWHPAVALAVADWLDEESYRPETPIGDGITLGGPSLTALRVATAYLGGQS